MALLAEKHRLALLVPGDQVEVLPEQTDRAIKYHTYEFEVSVLSGDELGELMEHSNSYLGILDNEHRCR